MVCYNCNSEDGHQSFDCPHPQRFTRCAHCTKVAFTERSHSSWCENKNFVSSSLSPNDTVFATTQMVEISFKGVRSVHVKDIGVYKRVTCDPLYMANENAITNKKDAHLVCSMINIRNELQMNLENANNETVMYIERKNNLLTVNDRYRICNGIIETNISNSGRARNVNRIVLKVQNNDEIFEVKLYERDVIYTFEVSSAGAVFVDPIKEEIDYLRNVGSLVQDDGEQTKFYEIFFFVLRTIYIFVADERNDQDEENAIIGQTNGKQTKFYEIIYSVTIYIFVDDERNNQDEEAENAIDAQAEGKQTKL